MVKKGKKSGKEGSKKKSGKSDAKKKSKGEKGWRSWKNWRTRQKDWKSKHQHLFNPIKRNYSIGNDTQPKRDVSRMVRWPKYIVIQRQKKILMERLKVPPAINQFTRFLDKNGAHILFNLLWKYRTESRLAKKNDLRC